jgi:hypothetical protein
MIPARDGPTSVVSSLVVCFLTPIHLLDPRFPIHPRTPPSLAIPSRPSRVRITGAPSHPPHVVRAPVYTARSSEEAGAIQISIHLLDLDPRLPQPRVSSSLSISQDSDRAPRTPGSHVPFPFHPSHVARAFVVHSCLPHVAMVGWGRPSLGAMGAKEVCG